MISINLVVSRGGATLIEPPVYEYDYNEFLDVEGIQPALALKYRVKITDRFKIPDATDYTWLQLLEKFPYDYQAPFGGAGDLPALTDAEMGGGLGRWLMHCHILHHAGLGMMTDFCIAGEDDPERLADLAVRRLRGKIPQLWLALRGRVTPSWLAVARPDRRAAALRIEVIVA